MPSIGAHLIFGDRPEPFLEAALRSVEWVDYYCAINTAPEDARAQYNESVVRRAVPREKLRLERFRPVTTPEDGGAPLFDFAKARNRCLDLADEDDYVLIVDSDDIHWPEFEGIARDYVSRGHDILNVHFFHLAVYKDLLHSLRHREILFTRKGARFERGVHELMSHPRAAPALIDGYRYEHLGYVKPAREVAARWELYRSLGGDVHEYDRAQPDRALDAWVEICTPHWREHPPAVRELLESYPEAPKKERKDECRVGLVLLTWNDASRLADCLASLAVTEEPFYLEVVDNGSTDGTLEMLYAFAEQHGNTRIAERPDLSLSEALNVGFGEYMTANGRPPLDYVGWIHPDMVFEWPDWLGNLAAALDEHPEWAKLGAWEVDQGREPEPWAGNSQCFLIRRSALEVVGLFDTNYVECGGREDWDHNRRLMDVGAVMITPGAQIRHNAMSTRQKHDNVEAGRLNAEYYCEKWKSNDPPV